MYVEDSGKLDDRRKKLGEVWTTWNLRLLEATRREGVRSAMSDMGIEETIGRFEGRPESTTVAQQAPG